MTSERQVAYRPATVEDIEALVTLRMAMLKEIPCGADPDPELEEAMRRYFRSALPCGDFMGYVAVAEEDLVATGGMVVDRHPPIAGNPNGRTAYIMNMYTLPAWRGRGIATKLFADLVALAKDKDCRRVTLHASPRGRPIYAKAGFRPSESEMVLDLRPSDSRA